jgi:hypothetical protein
MGTRTIAITGGCLCRAIRYRAEAEPQARSLCHCRTCRLAAGAPSLAWTIFSAASFAFTAGTPVRFQSSAGIWRTFCGQCGTALAYQRDDQPQTIDATTASLDDPDAYPPAVEIWTSQKLAWESLNGTIPQFPESSRKR